MGIICSLDEVKWRGLEIKLGREFQSLPIIQPIKRLPNSYHVFYRLCCFQSGFFVILFYIASFPFDESCACLTAVRRRSNFGGKCALTSAVLDAFIPIFFSGGPLLNELRKKKTHTQNINKWFLVQHAMHTNHIQSEH